VNEVRKKVAQGVFWSFLEKAGGQLVGFLITLLLARLLGPAEFGLVAIATAFFALSRVLIDAGLRDSLIQKFDATPEDFNTVFLFNLAAGLSLYLLLFFAAPFIADFYDQQSLVALIRVLSLNVVFYSFSIVQVAILTKELRFAAFFSVRLPSVIIGGLVGILMALNGYGVWALVAQIGLESLLFNSLLWRVSTWRPKLKFDQALFRFHWQHGSRLLLGEFITAIYRNIFSLVIGKTFKVTELGIYNRAENFIILTFTQTTGIVQSVTYPAMVQIQNDNLRLKSSYRKIIQMTLLVTLPIYLLFVLQAENIIVLLFTQKWIAAAPVLVVLSFAATLAPFNSINLNILKVKRRTDLFLRLQLVTKSIFVVVVIVFANMGFDYVIWTNLYGAIFLLLCNNYFSNRLIGYTLVEQLTDLAPFFLAFAGSLFVTMWANSLLGIDNILFEIVLVGVFASFVYVGFLVILRRSVLTNAMETIRELIKRKKAD
jgi:teichuronic acid exporter